MGRRASSLRSCRFAAERREAIFWGEGGGVDWSCVRVVFNSVVDIVGWTARACAAVTSSFGCMLAKAETLAEAVERMERSAVIAGRKPARSAAEIYRKHVMSGSKPLLFLLGTGFSFDLSPLCLYIDKKMFSHVGIYQQASIQHGRKHHVACLKCQVSRQSTPQSLVTRLDNKLR